MKRISRYIFLEILPIFLVCNFFFVFLMIIEQMVQLADLVFVHSIPITMIMKTLAYYMPSFLVLTIPISTLLAAMLAFSRFSSDSELVVMYACGISNFRLMKPILIFGVSAALLGIVMSTILLPKGSALAVENLNNMLQNLSVNNIREKEMYDDLDGMVFYADKKIDKANFERIILVYTKESAVISAKKGVIVPSKTRSLIMEFHEGRFTLGSKDNTYTSLDFEKLSLNLPIKINVDMFPIGEQLMSLKELRKNFKTGDIYIFEYFKRFSLPVSAIMMALFGASLGMFFQRSGRSLGLVAACALALGYNVLFIVGTGLVGVYNPIMLAIAPDIILMVLLIPIIKKTML